MSSLIAALLVWIGGETQLEVPDEPTVMLVGEERMARMLYGEQPANAADARGLYDRDSRTIYLREDWHSTKLADRATLLHELVHHAQTANDVPYECPAQLEDQAYHLTIKWLREQGVPDPYALLNTNELTITVRSMCLESASR